MIWGRTRRAPASMYRVDVSGLGMDSELLHHDECRHHNVADSGRAERWMRAVFETRGVELTGRYG